MAAGNWIMYDSAKEFIGDGTIDLDTQTFKITLHTNSYTPNRGTQSVYSDLTNELSTANGYTNGGATLSNVTWAQTSGTAKFDADDPSWTASGGNIGPFRIAVIRSTSGSEPLLCYSILEGSDLTINSGQTGTIVINASGILTLSGATS